MFKAIQDEKLPPKAYPEDVKKLSESDKAVLLIQYFDGEVMNGGIDNWLRFETGALVEETLQAMELVGAKISAAVIKGVLEVFSGQVIELDAIARHNQIDALSDEQQAKLEELGNIYCVTGREQDSIFERVVKYVEGQSMHGQE